MILRKLKVTAQADFQILGIWNNNLKENRSCVMDHLFKGKLDTTIYWLLAFLKKS